MKIRRYKLSLPFPAAFILCGWLGIVQCFADGTNAIRSTQSPEAALAVILSARAELDNELRVDSSRLSPQEFAATKETIVKQTKQLSKATSDFLERFPSNINYLQVEEQGIFSDVLHGMLHKDDAAFIGNMAEDIPSCLFDSKASKQMSISVGQASQLQATLESSFADAIIAAIKFGPESYNGVLIFMIKAKTSAGARLAEAIINNPTADDSLKHIARAILNRKFSVGKLAALKFTALDGRLVDTSEMRGKVVMVDFWATGCVPCMAQLPELESLYQKYHDQGFEIVGISSDDEQPKLTRVIQDKAIPWPVYMDEKGQTNEFEMAFGVTAIPNYCFIDRKGVVREIMADWNLEKTIQFLLAEPQ